MRGCLTAEPARTLPKPTTMTSISSIELPVAATIQWVASRLWVSSKRCSTTISDPCVGLASRLPNTPCRHMKTSTTRIFACSIRAKHTIDGTQPISSLTGVRVRTTVNRSNHTNKRYPSSRIIVIRVTLKQSRHTNPPTTVAMGSCGSCRFCPS